MAQMTEVMNTTGTVRGALTTMFANVQDALAKRSLYNRTFNELANLNDRELADLGIARYDIKNVAYDTAYGN